MIPGWIKRITIRLLLLSVSTGLALGSAELVLQYLQWPPEDPVWTTSNITGFKFSENLDYRHMSPDYDVVFQTNSLGLRDDEIGEKEKFRILLLGDSFTCGYGVDRKDLFADQLEQHLDVEVINAGVGGFESVHQLEYYKAHGKQFKPDLVVLALYLCNDLTNNAEWTTKENQLVRTDGKLAIEPKGTSKLVTLLKFSVGLRRLVHYARGQMRKPKKEYPGKDILALCANELTEEAQSQYQHSQQLLLEIQNEVHGNDVPFVIVSFPIRTVVQAANPEAFQHKGQTYNLFRPNTEIKMFCQQASIDYIPLSKELRDAHLAEDIPYYFVEDWHFNATGHRKFAELAAPHLAKRIQAITQEKFPTEESQPHSVKQITKREEKPARK